MKHTDERGRSVPARSAIAKQMREPSVAETRKAQLRQLGAKRAALLERPDGTFRNNVSDQDWERVNRIDREISGPRGWSRKARKIFKERHRNRFAANYELRALKKKLGRKPRDWSGGPSAVGLGRD